MVAVAGTMDTLRVLERRRITIADAELPGAKQPYHAAAELPIAKAEALYGRRWNPRGRWRGKRWRRRSRWLRLQGHEVAGCGIVLGSGKALPGLEGILASHALIHTAEGEMFREVLVWAAHELGLAVTGVPVKELDAMALRRIDSFGKLIGPPWTEDQKYATVAALMALWRG